MNNDLISRSELKKALCEFMKNNIGIYSNEMFHIVDSMPTVEQPQGCESITELKPLNPDNRGYTELFVCQQRGAYIHTPYDDDIDYRFCPYCGEKVKDE